jgi:hypothetical protein
MLLMSNPTLPQHAPANVSPAAAVFAAVGLAGKVHTSTPYLDKGSSKLKVTEEGVDVRSGS